MEAVGARLGRSSSRYGTTSVFSGPVRKWKKDWIPITPSSSSSSNNSNGNGVCRLHLFKWTPLSHNSNKTNINNNNEEEKEEEPQPKKFKYIPIAVLELQTKEAEENSDDEAKLTAELVSKRDGYDEKPDINDIPMGENGATEENQRAPGRGRQDLNESLDLSLGLTSHDEGHTSDSQTDDG